MFHCLLENSFQLRGKKSLGAWLQSYKDHKAKVFIFISYWIQIFFLRKFWSIDLTILSYKIGYETTVLFSWLMWSEAKHMANYTITEEFGWMVSSSVYYFSGLSPVADSWKPAAAGSGVVTTSDRGTFTDTPWWPLTIISSLYEVFYRKSWRVKRKHD